MHCTSVVIPIKKHHPSCRCAAIMVSDPLLPWNNEMLRPVAAWTWAAVAAVVGKMSAWFAMIYVWRDCVYSHPWFNGCYILESFLIMLMRIACFSKALTPQNHSETKTPRFKNKRITFDRGTSQPTKNTA